MEETLNFQRFLHFPQEAQTGFEPVSQGVADPCLTTWLLRLAMNYKHLAVAF